MKAKTSLKMDIPLARVRSIVGECERYNMMLSFVFNM